ncbi:MAG TPA: FAD-binding oxidoreductase [Trebonia sp.]|nr:FAD-binding oxidoreductase [Trebonia sp.]
MTSEADVTREALGLACANVRAGAVADGFAGVVPQFVASPSSTGEAAGLLRAAAALGLAVVPRGGGSRLDWGTPPARCDLVIDTSAMNAVLEHAAGDLVARVQAGARMGHVAEVLAAAGQEVALDVPPDATAGGVIADALAGPRRLRYGSPRDLLIGITIVRPDGTVARAGGKVVKNVAGYDLGKLFAGSAGTLGLIAEATFRLHPLPAARAWVTATFPAPGPGGAGGARLPAGAGVAAVIAAAANSPLVPSAVELHWPGPGEAAAVGVLLEGSPDGVAARAGKMSELLATPASPASAASPGALPAGAGLAAAGTAPGWWRALPETAGVTLLRATFWVSALGAVLAAIGDFARDAGVAPAVHGPAGAGLLYVTLPGNVAPEHVDALVAAVRGVIPAGRGSCRIARADGRFREKKSLEEVPGAALMSAVREQFDPSGIMSPGRFIG